MITDLQAGLLGSGGAIARLIESARDARPLRAAVVDPFDALSLGGALAAREQGLIEPLLIGDPARIAQTAERCGWIIRHLHVHPCAEGGEAAAAARLAAAGTVGAIVKGALHSDELLHAVLDRRELRTGRRLSHVVVTELPRRATPLLLTDGAVNIAPRLDEKREILENAIDVARRLGIARPHAALLAAVETVASSMPATVEAAALKELADRGLAADAVVDGPLALDDALSREAAQAKGIESPVAGCADILLSPEIETGNMLYKAFDRLLGARFGAVVVGAAVPIVLTSRGDSVDARVVSSAIARLLSDVPA